MKIYTVCAPDQGGRKLAKALEKAVNLLVAAAKSIAHFGLFLYNAKHVYRTSELLSQTLKYLDMEEELEVEGIYFNLFLKARIKHGVKVRIISDILNNY